MSSERRFMLIFYRREGFSLIEVLLVIFTLGVLFLPIMQYFFGTRKMSVDSWSSVRAGNSAQSLMEEIRSKPLASIMTWNGYEDTDGTYSRNVTIEYVARIGNDILPVTGPTTLYKIKVTLRRIGTNEVKTLCTIIHGP